MDNTIDDVLIEVNRVLLYPDTDKIRESCIRNIVDVYKKVGYKALYHAQQTLAVKNRIVNLPVNCIKVRDVKAIYNDKKIDMIATPYGSKYPTELSVIVEPSKLKLFSKDIQKVEVTYDSIPVSEYGEPLVSNDILTACISYCKAQELLIKGSVVKQDYATLNAASFWDRKARQDIDEARAFLNGQSDVEDRFVQLVNIIESNG